MLSNPPYGKSWKKDLEGMGGKDGMRDPRFKVMHNDEELNLVTRSSDGQLLFLANMVSKMNGKTKLGSRIAEVHNGSSLFTGDAGQGESNIRRWIIENDWLEAIVALPLNMFYNTGIATYIWVLSNKKAKLRQGKVQLIDATQWFKPLRKNLGKKNCELSTDDIQRICDTFLKFEETEQSKLFSNDAFGYRKIVVERPLRLHSQITPKAIASLRLSSGDEIIRDELYDRFADALFTDFAKVRAEVEKALNEWGADDEAEEDDEEGDDAPAKKGLPEKKKKKLLDAKTWERDGKFVVVATALQKELGNEVFEDHNLFRDAVEKALKKHELKLTGPELKVFLKAVSWRVETAAPVVAKVHKAGKATLDPLYSFYANPVGDKKLVIEYESDPDLRDTEQVPLQEEVEAFLKREVLPYTPDAWIDDTLTKIGYEISFTRHFYKPQPLRSLDEIRKDILAVEKETEGLLGEIIGTTRNQLA